MKRFLIPALFAFVAVTLLGLQPASGGANGLGTITATPDTIEAGESVDIVLEGGCFETNGVVQAPVATYQVMVTITDPNGATVFTQTFPGAPIIEFTFSDTPTLGTYTVTADCDVECEVNGDPVAANDVCVITEGEAGSAEVIGSYTPGEFTVVEGAAAPADVVAATPTFTG